jgi:hypothetical protein
MQGRPPKSVNMYWRRFEVSTIPVDDPKAFEKWLKDRWDEKEALLENYIKNGRFPADEGEELFKTPPGQDDKVISGAGYIETRVCLEHWYEIGHIFAVLGGCALLANIAVRLWTQFGDLFNSLK